MLRRLDAAHVNGSHVIISSCVNVTGPTCLGDSAQLLLADVIHVLLHLCGRLAHLSKGELRVDQNFGHHGLGRNTQRREILLNTE